MRVRAVVYMHYSKNVTRFVMDFSLPRQYFQTSRCHCVLKCLVCCRKHSGTSKPPRKTPEAPPKCSRN